MFRALKKLHQKVGVQAGSEVSRPFPDIPESLDQTKSDARHLTRRTRCARMMFDVVCCCSVFMISSRLCCSKRNTSSSTWTFWDLIISYNLCFPEFKEKLEKLFKKNHKSAHVPFSKACPDNMYPAKFAKKNLWRLQFDCFRNAALVLYQLFEPKLPAEVPFSTVKAFSKTTHAPSVKKFMARGVGKICSRALLATTNCPLCRDRIHSCFAVS